MTTVDTNILLRWLLGDVSKQVAAVEKLLASGNPLTVPDAAIIETEHVLENSIGYSRETVAAALESLLSMPQFGFDRLLWKVAINNYRDHPKLSIVDCYLAARAERDGAGPLYTFDRKLASQLDIAALLN